MSRILAAPIGGGFSGSTATPTPPALSDAGVVSLVVRDHNDDPHIPAGMVDAHLTYRGGHFAIERIERGGQRARELMRVNDALGG